MASAAQIRAGRAVVEGSFDDTKLQKGLTAARAKMKAWGASMSAVGTGLVTGAAIAAAPVALVTKVFAGFDDKMRTVKAVSGATEAQFQTLSARAKELGATTSFTAGDVADGMKYMAMAGYKTEQVLAGIPHLLNLARSGGLDLAAASDIATDVASAYGMTADEIQRVADVIARTATTSNTTVAGMGDSFKYVAAVSASAGQSIEETAAAFAVLGNSGVKASEAGTQLRAILVQFVNQKDKIRNLGVEVADSQGKMRPMLDVMNDIGVAVRKMSEVERLGTLEEIFGKIPLNSAAILTQTADAAGKAREQIAGAAGSAAKMSEEMDRGVGGALRKMASGFEGAGIAIGEALAPSITMLASIGSAVADWVIRNKDLVAGIGKLLTLWALFGGTLGLGVLLIGKTIGLFGSLITAAKGLGVVLTFLAMHPVVMAIAVLTAGIVALGIASSSAAGAQRELADAMSKVRQAGDEQRATDLQRLQYLESLAEQGSLNATQQREAAGIISELNKKYGDLGLTIAGTTGRLEGMATAQERVNAEMQKQAIAQLDKEIAEKRSNLGIIESDDPMQKYVGPQPGTATGGASGSQWSWKRALLGNAFAGKEDAPPPGPTPEQQAEKKALDDLIRRRERLKWGDKDAMASGDDEQSRLAKATAEQKAANEQAFRTAAEKQAAEKKLAGEATKAIEAQTEAMKELADVNEQAASRNRTALEQELAEIQKVTEERHRLLQAIEELEKKRAGGPRKEVTEWLDAQKASVSIKHVDAVRAAEKKAADEVMKEIMDANAEKEQAAKELAESQQDFHADLARTAAEQAEQAAQQRLDKAKGTSGEKAAQADLAAARQQMAQLDTDQWQKSQKAAAAEVYKNDPAKLQEAFSAIDQLAKGRMDLAVSGTSTAEKVASGVTSRGTFSAAGAGLLGGQGGGMADVAANTKKANTLLTQLLDATKRIPGPARLT